MRGSRASSPWLEPFHWGYLDAPLMVSWLVVLALGLLMVMSATQMISQHHHGQPWHYVGHQVAYVGLGVATLLAVYAVPLHWYRRWLGYLLLSCLLLLILIWVPGLGHRVNGSLRWLRLAGVQIQVCEWVKLWTIVFLADYIARRHALLQTQLRWFLKPMLVVVFFCALLLMQPDFGASAVLMAVALALLWVAGVPASPFWALLAVLGMAMMALVVFAPYRLARLVSFLHPWHNAFSSGYQLTQALIAFGRGGVWGVGLGHGLQKLFYLPEAHTDFLYAVLVEEMGLLGGMAVLGAYGVFVWRGVRIARQAAATERLFAAYLALGVTLWLVLQVFVNMGVNLGLLPTKGLTLPFMSYGGSSMVISCWALGLLMRVHYENENGSFYG